MATRGRAHHKWKDGYWSGWEEYRYGQKKKPTLAPVFNAEKRKHMINELIDVMSDWRSSPFEHEGALKAGLRSAICLKGYSWGRADNEAGGLLGAVFQRIGAKRPTWEQGQREYSIAPENCSWCGMGIPEELMLGTRHTRFCSSVCARSALQHRDFKARSHDDAAYDAALDTINRTKFRARECLHCSKRFLPSTINGKFCSHPCVNAYKKSLEPVACQSCNTLFTPRRKSRQFCSNACKFQARIVLEQKPCHGCGETFQPKQAGQLFCSRVCVDADKKQRQVENHCECCGVTFKSNRPKTTCSNSCYRKLARRKQQAGTNVIYLTAEIFDGWFKRAA